MSLVLILFTAITYLLTLTLFVKFAWNYFLVYLYAHYVVNRSDHQLRDSLGYFPGAWALVTGATDGIGKAYARQLARLGFNLILLGRSPGKLASTREELENNRAVQECRARLKLTNGKDWIRVALLDLSVHTDGPSVEKVLGPIIRGLDLRVLVNNAGICHDRPTSFLNLDNGGGGDGYEICKRILDVNATSVLNVTRACLRRMSLRPKQDGKRFTTAPRIRGIIINLSSFSTLSPVPLLTVYAATKAFIWHFGVCLAAEYESRGILVQTLIPYLVVTNMTKLKRATLMNPSADTYVRSALKMVSVQDVTHGYLPHALLATINGALNFLAPKFMGRKMLKVMSDITEESWNKCD